MDAFFVFLSSLHWILGYFHSNINNMEEIGSHPLTQMCFMKPRRFAHYQAKCTSSLPFGAWLWLALT